MGIFGKCVEVLLTPNEFSVEYLEFLIKRIDQEIKKIDEEMESL